MLMSHFADTRGKKQKQTVHYCTSLLAQLHLQPNKDVFFTSMFVLTLLQIKLPLVRQRLNLYPVFLPMHAGMSSISLSSARDKAGMESGWMTEINSRLHHNLPQLVCHLCCRCLATAKHGCIKRTGYSVGGGAPLIPMKVAQ